LSKRMLNWLTIRATLWGPVNQGAVVHSIGRSMHQQSLCSCLTKSGGSCRGTHSCSVVNKVCAGCAEQEPTGSAHVVEPSVVTLPGPKRIQVCMLWESRKRGTPQDLLGAALVEGVGS